MTARLGTAAAKGFWDSLLSRPAKGGALEADSPRAFAAAVPSLAVNARASTASLKGFIALFHVKKAGGKICAKLLPGGLFFRAAAAFKKV